MAQATRSLPPKRLAERAQLHRQAVTILAHRRARKAVERELQEQGLKPRYIGCYCRGWRKLPVVGGNLFIVAGHSPYEERLLILRIDDPKFFDCRFQRRCLIGCFDYTDEGAGRPLDGAINFPLGRLLGHGRAVGCGSI
jgi:hypothetical protein